ncbi:MAG: glycosyltransferase family 2 protein [Candidatus Paceibacterota bacterium]|jgi:glycosyltransferase involved in cell wall biosynthesis
MKPEITIIIPCYNCEGTLREAVESCFVQGLESFEIVMVDDGSTDETLALMEKLATEHPEIRIFRQGQNLGGGATRNRAVQESASDIIFCLDSDDALGTGTLLKMLSYLKDHKLDGVGVSTSIKFKGTQRSNVAYTTSFKRIGEKIELEDIFNVDSSRCSLYSVFMHTRRAFDIMGGYPTDHGFDTQCFALRFLANGLAAHACPDTTYFHRVNYHRSYYIREYEDGRANHNWMRIYDEFLYLFNASTQDKMLGFDFNGSTKPLNAVINEIKDPFAPRYRDFVTEGSKSAYKSFLSTSKITPVDEYWLGSEALRSKKPIDAASHFAHALASGLRHPIVLSRALDSLALASGTTASDVMGSIQAFNAYGKRGSLAPFWKRGIGRIRRMLS